jgi:hypothetical protein
VNDDDRFLTLADGDRALARAARSSLEHLATGAAGERLRSMAREVLAGELDLKVLVSSSVYAEDVTRHLDALAKRRDELGEDEFNRQADGVRTKMREANEALRRNT